MYQLPDQKIKESLKDEIWHMNHIDSYLYQTVRESHLSRREEQQKAYNNYYCLNVSDKKHITHPHGFYLGVPYEQYPLIESKIDQLIGEYLARKLKKKTYVINKRAKTAKLDAMFSDISEEILREANKDFETDLGFVPGTENPEKELPQDIEEFYSKDYKTVSEQVSDDVLKQVFDVKGQGKKIKQVLTDFLITEEGHIIISEENGHPCLLRVSPFDIETDLDPNEEININQTARLFRRFYSKNELINTFDLTDEEELSINNMFNSFSMGTPYTSSFMRGKEKYFTQINQEWFVLVTEMKWKSKKKMRVKSFINEKNGKEIFSILPEEYKKRKGDNIKTIWIDQKRFCIMAGPNICLDFGIDLEKYSRIDNIKSDSLDIVSIVRNYPNSQGVIRSVAKKLEQLQDFASEVLYEIRLAARRNPGKVFIYDTAQTPKQFLKTGSGPTAFDSAMSRVQHHIKKDQMIMINSHDKNVRNSFNQFTAVDMSNRGFIQEMSELLMLIEDLASKFVGISPQREGQVQQYETTGGIERAVTQSTARTEIYFKPFDWFMEKVMEKVLMKAKYVYEENQISQYIFGDLKSKFFKIYPEFFQDDIGVYIGDSSLEQKRKMIIDQAATQSLSQAQTPDLILSLVETLNAEYASESEAIFKSGLATMEKSKEEERKFQAEQNQITAETAQKRLESEENLKREGFENNLEVARIYANNKSFTENAKNNTQKSIKLADIEKEFELASLKEKKQ